MTQKLTAQTNRAHEPHIDNVAMAEARGAEIDVPGGRQHQRTPRRRVRQEPHHQVLQQALRRGGGHVDAARRVAGLLQQHRVAGQLEDVDRHALALRGEDGVHHGYVLRREVAGDAEDQDARGQRYALLAGCAVRVGERGAGAVGREGGVDGGVADGRFRDVGERGGERAAD